jgi:uncharacterized short protein YbdD (DUF466 family)
MAAAFGRGWRAFVWYVKGVLGENDYDHYVAHQRTRHPGEAVLSVGDYWKQRYAAQDIDPGGRCC